ncbi:MAG: hypothetical protein PWP04_945 [Candidatus Atribacteria bacterium]|nr:hypothetical protein [Candidatus Atribacteria bacterium]
MDELSTLVVGKLGRFQFNSGYYLYVGKARRNLRARITRHLNPKKKLHWHVDYLLTKARVEKFLLFEGDEECRLAYSLGMVPGVSLFIPGFGASDCNCPGHLFYIEEKKEDFWQTLPAQLLDAGFTRAVLDFGGEEGKN